MQYTKRRHKLFKIYKLNNEDKIQTVFDILNLKNQIFVNIKFVERKQRLEPK